jgi:hypothetical protein
VAARNKFGLLRGEAPILARSASEGTDDLIAGVRSHSGVRQRGEPAILAPVFDPSRPSLAFFGIALLSGARYQPEAPARVPAIDRRSSAGPSLALRAGMCPITAS